MEYERMTVLSAFDQEGRILWVNQLTSTQANVMYDIDGIVGRRFKQYFYWWSLLYDAVTGFCRVISQCGTAPASVVSYMSFRVSIDHFMTIKAWPNDMRFYLAIVAFSILHRLATLDAVSNICSASRLKAIKIVTQWILRRLARHLFWSRNIIEQVSHRMGYF